MYLKKALKTSLISVVLIAILCALFSLIKNQIESITPVGAREIFNMSHIPRYKKLIGQKYETQIDLVILNKKSDRDFYLLSAPGGLTLPSLDEIKKVSEFPYDYDSFSRIFGILPKGNRIKIINVLKIRLIKLGQPHDSFPILQAEITDNVKFRNYKVLLHQLTNAFYGNIDRKDVDTLSILKKFAIRVK